MISDTGKLVILCLISGLNAAFFWRSSEPSHHCLKSKLLINVDMPEEPKASVLEWKSLDLVNFDLYGNYLEVNDMELPEKHTLCKRFENVSRPFRKYAGFLLFNRGSRTFNTRFEQFEQIDSWYFDRLDNLIIEEERAKKALLDTFSYVEDDDDEEDVEFNEEKERQEINLSRSLLSASTRFWENLEYPEAANLDSAFKLKRSFPQIHEKDANLSVDQLALGELFVVDFVDLVMPRLRLTQITKIADLAGVLVFLVLLREKQGAGLAEFHVNFSEFFELMKKFSGNLLDLQPEFDSRDNFCLESLFEALFLRALNHDLYYTMELFFALNMVDFENEYLLKAVISSQAVKGGILLNRFFDFIDFKKAIWSNTSRIPLLHYIFDRNPILTYTLLDYDIDWSLGMRYEESGEDKTLISSGETILKKLLGLSRRAAFDFASDGEYVNHRRLLAYFISKTGSEGLLISRSPDESLLDLCARDEETGLRLLNEIFFKGSLAKLEKLTEIARDFLYKILEKWREEGGVRKFFRIAQFLLRNHYGFEDFQFLNEMMVFLGGLLQSNSDSRASPQLSSRSGSRSASSEIFRSFFSLKSSNSQESFAPVEESVSTPSCENQGAILDLMRMIVSMTENSFIKVDLEALVMIESWNNLIARSIDK